MRQKSLWQTSKTRNYKRRLSDEKLQDKTGKQKSII